MFTPYVRDVRRVGRTVYANVQHGRISAETHKARGYRSLAALIKGKYPRLNHIMNPTTNEIEGTECLSLAECLEAAAL